MRRILPDGYAWPLLNNIKTQGFSREAITNSEDGCML
jgi:hypothetical protein